MMAGGGSGAGDLLEAQKEVIVATWKVQRRSEAGKSESDIKAIAKAQSELKGRAEQMAAQSAAAMMRGSRRQRPGQPQGAAPAAGRRQSDHAGGGSDGQGRAGARRVEADAAIPHEMTAYNHLLRAQSDNKRTQVARQRGGGGGGGRSGTQDLSALFDRELMRQQETNYETRNTVEAARGQFAAGQRARQDSRTGAASGRSRAPAAGALASARRVAAGRSEAAARTADEGTGSAAA